MRRLLLVASLVAAPVAYAQSGQDVATAQALFEVGKRLMKAGKAAEACPKLAESHRLDPGAGTFLALALCHEAEGKTATAWADFNQVLSDARRDKRPEREKAALEHLAALEKKLTRVNLVVAQPVSGLEVKRDGTVVGQAQWGVPLPIDPGDHVFEAKAPSRKTWTSTVNVQGEGKTVEVKVPPLEEDHSATPPPTTTQTAPPPPPPTTTQTAPPPPPPPPPRDEGSGQRTLGWIVGGMGVVSLGVGSVFGLTAMSKWSDAEKACPGNNCTSAADAQKGKDAGSAADLSTVFVGVGLVGVAAGVILLVTAPSAPRTGVRVAPTLGGLVVQGGF
jgi:hypothetical protein